LRGKALSTPAGGVKGCKLVSAKGAMAPDYCKDGAPEKLEAGGRR